jgi:ADP-ribosyl-[dinitrogen reductase] hydrolase
MTITLLDRYRGCLLGLACGDAVGTTVEFSERGSFPPVTDMVGGGPFQLAPGAWTDDTSMALCLATSLMHCRGFDARDQMNRYVNWWQWGYLSSTGDCFDIGMTVQRALSRYQVTSDPMAGATDPFTAGNGSLMRLAPIVLFFDPDPIAVRNYAKLSSATTHAAPEALECCELFAELMTNALRGISLEHILISSQTHFSSNRVAEIAKGTYLNKEINQIVGSGYCVESLEAALWCFSRTRSFEEAVLTATNLGDDADTTAAIVGQLAGAFYGVNGIPSHWLERLHMFEEIDQLARSMFEMRSGNNFRESPLATPSK